MKLAPQPDNPLEWLGLKLNLAPVPILETQIAFNAARAIMSGCVLGVFEAIGTGAKSTAEIAAECKTDPRATSQLMHCLTGIGYLAHQDGRFSIPARMQKWMLRSSSTSVVDKMIFQVHEWNWMAGLEDFVRTGKTRDIHGTMTPQQWTEYQDAMRDVSATIAPQVAKKLPLSSSATRMLDIGGSHGLYSIALCRRWPALQATILELPGAVDRATQIAAREGLGERVKHQVGNALTDDLGEAVFDLVFISNVVHHFTVPENIALAKKVKRALKPGGRYVIGEFLRNDVPGEGGVIGATSDLYFALTSASGTWSLPEIQRWLTDAGFHLEKPLRVIGPPYVTVIGRA